MEMKTYEAVVIGSGAAGFQAACQLKKRGVDVAIVTEGVNCGTSRNAGSDKQTYYKLGLGGSDPDSVGKMARDLFRGGSMDGDNALCEAALSASCFLQLCQLGVEFPVNRYGEYIGYKTDHDPYARAPSAGPLTSKQMTESLQKEAERLEIPILDGCYAVQLLQHKQQVCGVLCLQEGKPMGIRCGDVVLATGGPAGIYEDSVYPEGHTGSTGLAIAAGATLQNLALWQYGLASVRPRWNVSGTYMQVLPRFVSIDEVGQEHDFLWEYFRDKYEGLSMVFLKGYQWPFDPQKAERGSSLIDMLVYRERVEKGRRVYLDFTKNPFEIDFEKLSPEAYGYLKKAEATFGRPIDRLAKMNTPAIELYRSKGVDIATEYLEIALCAQHCNGGIAVDLWWQTSVKGLFAVGECAGTHGISRPGGSALNAGQVGGLRAAQYIAAYPNSLVDEDTFAKLLENTRIQKEAAEERMDQARRRMSTHAAAVRDPQQIQATLEEICRELPQVTDYRLREILLTQAAVLTAMSQPQKDPDLVQEVTWTGKDFRVRVRKVRPIPEEDAAFETVWRDYRQHKNIY